MDTVGLVVSVTSNLSVVGWIPASGLTFLLALGLDVCIYYMIIRILTKKIFKYSVRFLRPIVK